LDRELLWLFFAGVCTPAAAGERLGFVVVVYAVGLFFVVLPLAEPRWGWLLGVKVPKNYVRPAKPTLVLLVNAIVEKKSVFGAVLAAVYFVAFAANRILYEAEDVIFPSIARAQPKKYLWVLGQDRASTSRLHKALCAHESAVAGSKFDVIFSSITLKFVATHLSFFLDKPLEWISQALSDHPIIRSLVLFDGIEEHAFMLHFACTEILCFQFGALCSKPDNTLELLTAVSDQHLEYMKRSLQRIIWFNDYQDCVYIGKPLLLTRHFDKLLSRFPHSEALVCIRNPRAVFPSELELLKSAACLNLEDHDVQAFVRNPFLDHYESLYIATHEILKSKEYHSRVHVVPNSSLESDEGNVLCALAPVIGLDFDVSFISDKTKPSESLNGGRPVARLTIVPEEEYLGRLEPIYCKIDALCKTR